MKPGTSSLAASARLPTTPSIPAPQQPGGMWGGMRPARDGEGEPLLGWHGVPWPHQQNPTADAVSSFGDRRGWSDSPSSSDGSAAAVPSAPRAAWEGPASEAPAPAPARTSAGSFKNLLAFQECVKGNIYVEISYNGNNLPVRQATETVP